jgi:quercetin dioxygenase-like cupin family protein
MHPRTPNHPEPSQAVPKHPEPSQPAPNHLSPVDARVFHLHGVTFSSFASTANGARSIAAWQAEFAPRTPGRPHTMTEEEVLHVLTGALEMQVDDDRFTAVSGDAVLVPAGAVLTVGNAADEVARAWVTSVVGMKATMLEDGAQLAPPWAQ